LIIKSKEVEGVSNVALGNVAQKILSSTINNILSKEVKQVVTELKIQRERAGIRAWRLANLCGISSSLLSLYETGRKRVPADVRYKLASQLGISVDVCFPEYTKEALNGL